MQARHDPIGWWALPLRAGMIEVFARHISLILVAIRTATVLRAPIGEEPPHRHSVSLKDRHPLISKSIGGCPRRLALVEFGKGPLTRGSNEGLLVDPASALQRADIDYTLCPTIARTCTLKFALRFFLDFSLTRPVALRAGSDFPGPLPLLTPAAVC
jgi:hypothetical protein